jgi:hypothetical protein
MARVEVPVGVADFPHEMIHVPEPWARLRFPRLLQYTVMPRGGHFAAMEEGASLAADVFGFVGKAMAYSTGERASAAGEM